MTTPQHPTIHGPRRPGRRAIAPGLAGVLVGLAAFSAAPAALAASPTQFTTPGTTTFTVPTGVQALSVAAVGAAGGVACTGGTAAQGASISGTVAVTAGEQLTVSVGGVGASCVGTTAGGGGVGGGGSSNYFGGGGGGGSGVSLGIATPTPSSELIVAGGGGAGSAGPLGATGQQGPAGAAGATGPAGAPGAGYQLTTASGDNGPTLTSAGTYLIDVSTAVFNQTSSDIGECAVIATGSAGLSTGFNTVWQEPVDNEGTFSLSGMIAVPSGYAPEALSLTCTDSSGGNLVTTLSTSWWVSPVATTPGSTVSESAQSAKAG